MLILGLTGGIATGKSTTSKILAENYRFPIIDADIVARQVVDPGRPALKRIVEHFGPDSGLLLENGNLNREQLGKLIFGEDKAAERAFVNSVIHPAVRKEMIKQLFWHWITGAKVVVFDVPLLFESKLDILCAKTLVVACSEQNQLERLLARNPELSREDAENRIVSQMSLEHKRNLADIVIENDGGLEELQHSIAKVVDQVSQAWILWVLEWIVSPFGLIMAGVTATRNYLRKRKAKI